MTDQLCGRTTRKDPTSSLGLHLLRNPRCARFMRRINGLDPRLAELVAITCSAPRLVQLEGLRSAAWTLASRPAFELAAYLEMLNANTRAPLPSLRECLDELGEQKPQ